MTEPTDKELTAKVKLALRNRYCQPEWSLFFEVEVKRRRADAIAFNIYPSRNFRIVGFEIKASRSDWLTELRNGAKADPIISQCDEYYIIEAKKGIVLKEELPEGWGLLTLRKTTLRQHVASKIPYASNPSREFFARVIEQSYRQNVSIPELWEAEQRGKEKGRVGYVDNYEYKNAKEKADTLDKLKANGIDFYTWHLNDIKRVKLAMDLLNHLDDIEYKIDYLKERHTSFVKALYSTHFTIDEIKKLKKEA